MSVLVFIDQAEGHVKKLLLKHYAMERKLPSNWARTAEGDGFGNRNRMTWLHWVNME